MKRKLIALTLVTILAILAFGSATIAYFTDTAEVDTNTFTVGSVKIELNQNEIKTEDSSDVVPGREIELQPTVTNTGKSAAYVRIRVLIPVNLFNVLSKESSWNVTALVDGTVTSNAATYYQDNNNTLSNDFIVTRGEGENAVKYYSFDFTYTASLDPKATTVSCWNSICISSSADHDDLENITEFKVLVEADAIQAKGFETATDAFEAFDKQPSSNS